LKTSADSLHAQEKEHDFLLDALGGSHFNAKSDRLLGPAHVSKSAGSGLKKPTWNRWCCRLSSADKIKRLYLVESARIQAIFDFWTNLSLGATCFVLTIVFIEGVV
jgi:hypothetical protein